MGDECLKLCQNCYLLIETLSITSFFSTWELVKLVGFFFGICTKESVSLRATKYLTLQFWWYSLMNTTSDWIRPGTKPTLSDWKHEKPNAMLWSKKASVQQISRCLIPQSYNRRLVGTIHSNTFCSPKVSGTKNAGTKKPKIASYFRAAFLLTTPFLGTKRNVWCQIFIWPFLHES